MTNSPSELERQSQSPVTAAALSAALATYQDIPFDHAPGVVRRNPTAFEIIRRAAHEHLACLFQGGHKCPVAPAPSSRSCSATTTKRP